jgi:hypothetical protein
MRLRNSDMRTFGRSEYVFRLLILCVFLLPNPGNYLRKEGGKDGIFQY